MLMQLTGGIQEIGQTVAGESLLLGPAAVCRRGPASLVGPDPTRSNQLQKLMGFVHTPCEVCATAL